MTMLCLHVAMDKSGASKDCFTHSVSWDFCGATYLRPDTIHEGIKTCGIGVAGNGRVNSGRALKLPCRA